MSHPPIAFSFSTRIPASDDLLKTHYIHNTNGKSVLRGLAGAASNAGEDSGAIPADRQTLQLDPQAISSGGEGKDRFAPLLVFQVRKLWPRERGGFP